MKLASGGFEIVCEIEPPTRPDLRHARHQIGVLSTTERYLDAESPTAPPVAPPLYFASAPKATDASEVHERIRERAARLSERGAAALANDAATMRERLAARIGGEPANRVIAVMGGMVLSLDGYLETRIVELIVHLDDLAVTVGVNIEPPEDATRIAVSHLVDVCRVRNGDLALLRALARRERDHVDALRAL